MQDLSGPKIRTGPLEGGQAVTLTPGHDTADRRRRSARHRRSHLHAVRAARPIGQSRRPAAPGRRPDRAAGEGAARRRARDGGDQWGPARTAQGHQRARRRAPRVVGHREGRAGSALRAARSASISSRSASCRRPATCWRRSTSCARPGGPCRSIAKIERPAAVDNLDSILERRAGGDGGARRPRAGNAARAGAARAEAHHPARPRGRACRRFSPPRCSSRCASSRGRRAPRSATPPTR